jgi:Protein of unknown function (DUF1552)
MKTQQGRMTRTQVNRRAFLRGVGTVAVGLPFLEGLPSRSAWAADAAPVFSFFIVGQCGVVQDKFWPSAAGALTAATLAGKSLEKLSAHMDNLLIVKGLKFPGGSSNCSHAQGCVQAITGIAPGSSGNSSTAGGPSADMVISKALNPAGTDPLTLYTGQQRGAFIAERTSFSSGMTPARAAQQNPYETYKKLVNLPSFGTGTVVPAPTGGGTAVPGPSEADEILLRQKSVNDLVRDEFKSLLARTDLSAEDRRRLDAHLVGIRQLELNMVSTGETMNEINEGSPSTIVGGCADGSINKTGLDAFKSGVVWNGNGHMIEDIGRLHGETVALAFACNYNRTATLQWGDGTDGTVYKTQATGGYNNFHKISHRTNSDIENGNDQWAKDAHFEIDGFRMESLAYIIQAFKDRGLLETSYILWTNSISDGPSHAFNPIPIVIAGSGGGFLKQGQYLNTSGTNAKILASLVTAAGVPTENFGAGGGQLTEAHA